MKQLIRLIKVLPIIFSALGNFFQVIYRLVVVPILQDEPIDIHEEDDS